VRGGQGSNPRQQWIDRNPLSIAKAFIQTAVAPHATTSRWSYTVPAARKCQLEMAQQQILRETAAAPVNFVSNVVRYTPSGGALTTLIRIDSLLNTVGATAQAILGGAVTGYPGDQFEGVTSDASTGGTNTFVTTAKFTEFDA
jgi:hypothetical protein